MKNLSSNAKFALGLTAAVVVILLSIVFWAGVASHFSNDSQSSGSSSSSSSSGRSAAEEDYLDLLYDAHAEDGDSGHTFANDGYAVVHGHTVCELLDTYYIEDIADALASNNEGILWGVSVRSKAYGIGAASVHLCPEHAEEVYRWIN